MSNVFIKTSLSIAIALSIASCGSSNDTASVNTDSSLVSTGSITGFGSVYVNGVKFETDSATFDVDGKSGTQDDLAIGMVVKIEGSINTDGTTGNATNITFDDETQGPVTGLTAVILDDPKRSFEIFGTTVIVDSGTTSFDIDDDLPINTVFDFYNINMDGNTNNVEVSGFFDSNGDILATRVELKDINFTAGSTVEIKGTITNLNNFNFTIGNLMVDASAAALKDLPNGLADGQFVEVKGTLNADFTLLTAIEVEAEDDSYDDSNEFEVEGIITNYDEINKTFSVNGIDVDASSTSIKFKPETLSLQNDLRVEVEGSIINGILIAEKIELEGGDMKVEAFVSAIDVASNTFEVTPNPGMMDQKITITVTTGTKFENDFTKSKTFSLSDLLINDFVEVEGFSNATGGITATEVEVDEADDIKLQGYATAASGNATDGSITVLGITYSIDSNTEFEGEYTIDSIAQLISAIENGDMVLVKIKDEQPNGIADKIEVE